MNKQQKYVNMDGVLYRLLMKFNIQVHSCINIIKMIGEM